ncbi:MAG TPA: hypothetical protein VFY10_02550 [Dehalococcoidia bacterium]|nr:hypothetical protein [Dehalococcoidia bacterium]
MVHVIYNDSDELSPDLKHKVLTRESAQTNQQSGFVAVRAAHVDLMDERPSPRTKLSPAKRSR